MNKFKKTARGALFIFLGSIIGSGFAYLFRMVLVRRISVEEYGLFASVIAFITLFEIFRSWGLSHSLVKFVSNLFALEKKEEGNKIAYITLIVETVLAILLATIIKAFDQSLALNYFKQPFAVFVISWGLIYFVLEAISSVFRSSFQGIQKIHLSALKKPLFNIFSFIGVLLIPFDGAILPVISVTFGLFLSTMILGILFFRNFPIRSLKIVDFKKYLPGLFSFGFPLALASLGAMVIAQFDTIMLTSMKGLREVGIYNIILPFAMILSFLGQGLEKVLFPLTSEFEAKDSFERIKSSFNTAYKFSIVGSLFLSLPLFIFSEFLLAKFFTLDYVVGSTAFRILLIGVIFLIISNINIGILFGLGKTKKIAKISFVSASSNIFLNLILIPTFGINGAAIATTFSFILNLVLSFYSIRKEINVSFPLKRVLITSFSWIASLAIGFLIMNMEINLWLKLILSLIISSSIFTLLVLFLKSFELKDIKSLFLIIKK
jgi:stage V sporulation protein B